MSQILSHTVIRNPVPWKNRLACQSVFSEEKEQFNLGLLITAAHWETVCRIYLITKPSGHHLFYSLLGFCRVGGGSHQECFSKYFFISLWDILNCGKTGMLIYPLGKSENWWLEDHFPLGRPVFRASIVGEIFPTWLVLHSTLGYR